MPEITVTVLVVAPMLVIAYSALKLVKFGSGPNKMSEASRQRLAGCGLLLLSLAVAVSLAVLGAGIYCAMTVLKVNLPCPAALVPPNRLFPLHRLWQHS